jgi:hypothetical protein
MTKKQPTIKSLREDSPWDIAKKFGLHYSGDLCPVPHGGMWYRTKNWVSGDRANAIRISESEGTLWVELIAITRIERDLESVKKYADWESAKSHCTTSESVACWEIESFACYSGSEVLACQTFNSDNGRGCGNFPEFQIMRSVRDMWFRLFE